MKYQYIFIFLVLLGWSSPHTTADVYEYKRASPDGTGKIYLGREISHVMGHLGANWLERKSREREEATNLLVNKLPLEIDSIVADIGAGTGYFTFRIAQRVTHGTVIAVDIQDEMLDFIEKRQKTGNIKNIKTIKGSVESINIPDQSVDLILLVDAYHEFSHPYEMGLSIAKALKAGGQLVLVEYRAEDPNVPIKRLHKMSERQVVKEITELGLLFESNADYLPRQHVLTFRKR